MTTPAAHVAAMLKYSPDARLITYGSLSTYGTIRTSDDTIDDGDGGGVRRRLIVITLPTDAFTALAEGDALTVYATKLSSSGTTAYTVRDLLRVEDGLITKARVVAS